MDGAAFDVMIQSLAAAETRRHLLRRAVAGALGVGLAGAGVRAVAAEECRGSEVACRRDDQCCSGRCRNGTCRGANLNIGHACDPNRPDDCGSGVCGCIFNDDSRCTCRRATCVGGSGATGCGTTADCCAGSCLQSRDLCVVFKPGRPWRPTVTPGKGTARGVDQLIRTPGACRGVAAGRPPPAACHAHGAAAGTGAKGANNRFPLSPGPFEPMFGEEQRREDRRRCRSFLRRERRLAHREARHPPSSGGRGATDPTQLGAADATTGPGADRPRLAVGA